MAGLVAFQKQDALGRAPQREKGGRHPGDASPHNRHIRSRIGLKPLWSAIRGELLNPR
jgi:hypothetical protein